MIRSLLTLKRKKSMLRLEIYKGVVLIMRNDIDNELRIQANDRKNEDMNHPLEMFSTTQLKKELRRRKGIIECK